MSSPDDGLSRRTALGLALTGSSLLVAACRASQEAPRPAAGISLASLPEGAHVRLRAGEQPIELIRRGSEVEARSLWCTHMGCEVRWNAGEARYLCPCHAGIYDASGAVVAGPPPRPLRRLEVRVVGDQVELPTLDLARSGVPPI